MSKSSKKTASGKQRAKEQLEQIFAELGREDWVGEYKFATPNRNWRFDYCWPDLAIAIELDGGGWTTGRHHREPAYSRDCVKLNIATGMGWKVYRLTPLMIRQGVAQKILRDVLVPEVVRLSIPEPGDI